VLSGISELADNSSVVSFRPVFGAAAATVHRELGQGSLSVRVGVMSTVAVLDVSVDQTEDDPKWRKICRQVVFE